MPVRTISRVTAVRGGAVVLWVGMDGRALHFGSRGVASRRPGRLDSFLLGRFGYPKGMFWRSRVDPVDTWPGHEWEADFANRIGLHALFWMWYLPADLARVRLRLRSATGLARRWRVRLRSPLNRAESRGAFAEVRLPIHPG
jgi:hypothetical protein